MILSPRGLSLQYMPFHLHAIITYHLTSCRYGPITLCPTMLTPCRYVPTTLCPTMLTPCCYALYHTNALSLCPHHPAPMAQSHRAYQILTRDDTEDSLLKNAAFVNPYKTTPAVRDPANTYRAITLPLRSYHDTAYRANTFPYGPTMLTPTVLTPCPYGPTMLAPCPYDPSYHPAVRVLDTLSHPAMGYFEYFELNRSTQYRLLKYTAARHIIL